MSPEFVDGPGMLGAIGVTEGGASGAEGAAGKAVIQTLWFTLVAGEKVEVPRAARRTVQAPTVMPVTTPLEVTEQFGVPYEMTEY